MCVCLCVCVGATMGKEIHMPEFISAPESCLEDNRMVILMANLTGPIIRKGTNL